SRLKCRGSLSQVLSRSLTLAGTRQNHLDAETSIAPLVRIEQRGFIGLNALQGMSQRVLVPAGRMHRKGTKANNSQCNQHCRDQAYGSLGLELFHKSAHLQAVWITVNKKKQKVY